MRATFLLQLSTAGRAHRPHEPGRHFYLLPPVSTKPPLPFHFRLAQSSGDRCAPEVASCFFGARCLWRNSERVARSERERNKRRAEWFSMRRSARSESEISCWCRNLVVRAGRFGAAKNSDRIGCSLQGPGECAKHQRSLLCPSSPFERCCASARPLGGRCCAVARAGARVGSRACASAVAFAVAVATS